MTHPLLTLLSLLDATDVVEALDRALEALVEGTGAVGAYVEVDGEGLAERRSVGLPDAGARARVAVSRGVLAEAVATGRTVVTRAAVDDPRFAERESVRVLGIGQVICTPVGRGGGALYVQGSDTTPFTDEDVALVEAYGRHLAAIVERVHARRPSPDPTAPWRQRLAVQGLVGRSEALARLLRELDQVAHSDLSVLLTGPSGTGKSQVARALHDSSPRRDRPFVVVDCPSVPETLFEAELFGAEPGAFTGASARRDGLIRAARGGTLFLDEVGDLSSANQARLLHFLETRGVRRLGSERSEVVDVRVVSATHRELEDGATFRADLFWRLAGFPLRVPSLAERPDDVPLLLERFVAEASPRAPLTLSPGLLRAAMAQPWPGQVRELQHHAMRAVLRARQEGCEVLEARHLFPDRPADDGPLSFQEQTRRFQKELLRSTLQACRWNVTEAARRLDLARSHVYTLIAAFGLEAERG